MSNGSLTYDELLEENIELKKIKEVYHRLSRDDMRTKIEQRLEIIRLREALKEKEEQLRELQSFIDGSILGLDPEK